MGEKLGNLGSKHWLKAVAFISLVLFAYVLGRAWLVPITFDEFWSYDSYASKPLANILSFKWPTANNHPGNSILMKVCLKIFGNSPFSLRLPNVLSFAAFLFYARGLAKQFQDWRLGLSLFLFLVLNPYMLDFFGLARGYGLALACAMAALHHLFALLKGWKWKHLISNAFFASLSVFCNFSYLHFLLANGAALLLLLTYLEWRNEGTIWAKLRKSTLGILPLMASTAVLAAYMYKPVKALMAANELYYGGESGFWSDTVYTLCHAFIYLSDLGRYDLITIRLIVLGLLVLMFVCFSLESSQNPSSEGNIRAWMAAILMILPCIVATVQHFELGSAFLIYRTAMFLYLPFFIGLVELLALLDKVPAIQYLSRGLWIALLLAVLINFGAHANLSHSTEWRSDASTPEVLDRIAGNYDVEFAPVPSIRVGLSWQLRPCFNYYLHQKGISWIAEANFEGCQPGYDYYYVLGEGDGCKLPKEQLPFGKQPGLELISNYPLSNTSLWRNMDLHSPDSLSNFFPAN